ncbi:fimbrial protein [Citrobacter enshiensis]|uniref:Fimbrial protein n=1 Tax=Citrobacter enshiensis TaxID=2971264 RepID=A0ABT8PQZ1_9ENTR|nr:fimbrial protein [Citrobacter enshiensis]MDN8598755.1 fimbrial protein [Citrobacter enshiensis]WET42555.1 fimbrial protein [Citrobacter enshiensis]
MKLSVFFKVGLIASASMGMVNAAHAVGSSSGTINFEGKITASTCEATVNGVSNDGTVTLPPIAISAFTDATAGRTPFTIELANCALTDPDTKVGTFFEPDGIQVDSETGHLNNTATTGPATGVSLQLANGTDDSPILVGDAGQTGVAQYVTPDATSKTGTLSYFVEYYKISGGTLAPGAVQSKVVYDLIYK